MKTMYNANAEAKEALKLIYHGIGSLIESLDSGEDEQRENEQPVTRGKSVSAPAPAVDPDVATEPSEIEDDFDPECLEDYSYNELKKIAKELGLSAKGTKPELIERIKESQSTAVAVEPDTSVSPSEDEVVDNDNGSDIVAKVNEAVKDMTDEDLADILVSCGISASGKRKALIDKIVVAVKEGAIAFDDDEDEDEDLPEADSENVVPEPPVIEPPVSEDNEDEDGEDFKFESPSGLNNPDDKELTRKRAKAINTLVDDIIEDINNQGTTETLMINYLVSYGYDKKDVSKLPFVDLVNYYIDTKAMFIDDDGNTLSSEEPYSVNDVPYCCGYELKKTDNTYICEACGSEYEAEE